MIVIYETDTDPDGTRIRVVLEKNQIFVERWIGRRDADGEIIWEGPIVDQELEALALGIAKFYENQQLQKLAMYIVAEAVFETGRQTPLEGGGFLSFGAIFRDKYQVQNLYEIAHDAMREALQDQEPPKEKELIQVARSGKRAVKDHLENAVMEGIKNLKFPR